MNVFSRLSVSALLVCAAAPTLRAQPFDMDAQKQGLKGDVHWVKRTWYSPKPGTTEPDKTSIPDIYLRTNQLLEYSKEGKLKSSTDFAAGTDDKTSFTDRNFWQDGRLTKTVRENADYETVFTTLYTYNAAGGEVKRETKAGPGDKMGLFAGMATTDETAWSGGRKTTLTTRGSDGRVMATTSFTHDATGRIIREDYAPTGLYAARTFNYDAQGRTTEEKFLDKTGAPASTTTIVYGVVGKPIKRTTTSFYNGQKTGEDVTLMVYNKQGDLIGRKNTKDGKNTGEYHWQHTYDDRGNRIETVHLKGATTEVVEVLKLLYY